MDTKTLPVGAAHVASVRLKHYSVPPPDRALSLFDHAQAFGLSGCIKDNAGLFQHSGVYLVVPLAQQVERAAVMLFGQGARFVAP